MKKIRIYVSALIVLSTTFAFTSCVDDSESPAVKEIREAYANQLKAQVELSKAQMEADKIKAEAEALLIQAQTEQAKSQTKLNEANTALALAQTDAEKTKAETDQIIAAEELKALQAKVKLELEEYKYKLEQVQMVAELEMLKLKAELDNAKNQQDEVLRKAINDYKFYIGEVNSLKKTLATAEVNLVYNKAVLADLKSATEANTAETIRMYNNWILATELQIASDKKQISLWNAILTNINATKLEKEIADKTKEYEALLVKQSVATKEYSAAYDVFEDGAKKDLVNFQNIVGKYYTGNAMPNNMAYYTLTEINTTISEETKKIASYQALIEENNAKIKTLKAQTESLYIAKNKAETESNRLYTLYEQAREAYYNTWSSADYEKMNTAYNKYSAASAAYSAANNAYYSNQNTISTLEYQNSDMNYSINNAASALKTANNRKAAYGGDPDKAKKLAEAYTAAEKKYNVAYTAYATIESEVRSMASYIQELNTVYFNSGLIYPGTNYYGTYSSSIGYVKDQITNLENRILSSQEDLAQYKRDITNAKELNKRALVQLDQKIKDAEAEIATLKTLIPVVEKQAGDAKAIIDARMK